MSEDQEILIFNTRIDQMLGLEQSGTVSGSDIPDDTQAALTLASRLIDTDFQSEMRPQPELRARWISHNSQFTATPLYPKTRRLRFGWVWAAR